LAQNKSYNAPLGHHRVGTRYLYEIKGNAKARYTRKPTQGAAGRNADSDVAWEYRPAKPDKADYL
jgi:hypothetical protein